MTKSFTRTCVAFFLAMTGLANGATLVARDATWTYGDIGTPPGAGWNTSNFNDDAWLRGPAPLGYGNAGSLISNSLSTAIRYGTATNKYPAYYFRRSLVVTNAAWVTNISAGIQCDDGGIVYVNGHEVWRTNMAAGPSTYTNFATIRTYDSTNIFTFPIPAGTLVDGTNVVAVEVHQDAPGSSDVLFGLSMTGLRAPLYAASPSPYADYARSMKITFTGYTGRSNALTNFPALVKLNTGIPGFAYDQFRSATNADLRFTSSTGDELPYDIDTWDIAGTSCVWVKVPAIARDGTTSITAYWGKSGVTAPTNAADTWDTNFKGVYHLGESSSPAYDATRNGKDGSWNGNRLYAGGAIGAAQQFDCSNDAAPWDDPSQTDVSLPTGLITGGNYTKHMWARLPTGPVAWGNILSGDTNGAGLFTVRYEQLKAGSPWEEAPGFIADPTLFPRDVWQHVAATLDSGTLTIYRNGVPVNQATNCAGTGADTTSANTHLHIGSKGDGANGYRGQLDETRISDVVRSIDWLWAEYQTAVAHTNFQTYAPVSGADTRQDYPSSRRATVTISEIMYNPAPAAGSEGEFVEICNADVLPLDISGWRLDGDIQYAIPAGVILPAFGRMVVARDVERVEANYALTGVLGPYSNSMPDGGGTVSLRNDLGATLVEVSYDDQAPWPVSADGAGHSLVLTKPDYGEGDVHAWSASARAGGSPGSADPSVTNDPLAGICINEWLPHTDPPYVDYLELYNAGATPVDIGGCWLSDQADNLGKFMIPSNSVLGPGAWTNYPATNASMTHVLPFALAMRGGAIYLASPAQDRILDAVKYDAQERHVSSGRCPDGTPAVVELKTMTPGTSNGGARLRDVVINEIMYHPITESDSDEYIELYNRSTSRVDVGYWRFTAGIDFAFPPGTVVPAMSGIVVAKNVTNLLAKYPQLNPTNCFGNYGGSLSDGGERVALSKPDDLSLPYQDFVVMDEVIYSDGWGQWSDGDGSSLELQNPDADNRLAMNWASSDESGKSSWQTYTATNLADNAQWSVDATTIQYYSPERGLQLMLMAAGECLVDNMVVRRNGGGNIFTLGTFESGLGSWSTWPQRGTHKRSRLETEEGDASARCLRVTADDGGDNRVNCLASYSSFSEPLQSNDLITLQVSARWLAGSQRMLMKILGNPGELSACLSIPPNLGTPGLPNSRFTNNVPPAMWDLSHSPILPAAGQGAVVCVGVAATGGLSHVQLDYRVDPGFTTNSLIMNDAGTDGDAIASDGVYSATLPGQSAHTMVGFRVTAVASGGAAAQLPGDFEALIQFGQITPGGSICPVRAWMTASSHQSFSNRFLYDNSLANMTMVYGGYRAIYGAGLRYRGTWWGRPNQRNPPGAVQPEGWLVGVDPYTSVLANVVIKVPKSDRILGDNQMSLGIQGNDATFQREMTTVWMARRMKIPCLSWRYMHLYINESDKGVRYDEDRPSHDYVRAWFNDRAQGDLFSLQHGGDVSVNGDGNDGTPPPAWTSSERIEWTLKYTTMGGAFKQARYRWLYNKTPKNAVDDDYASVFRAVDALTGATNSTYETRINAALNVDSWLDYMALKHTVVDWDSIGYQLNGPNAFLYAPAEGKAHLILWDIGQSMQVAPTDALFNTNAVLQQQLFTVPAFLRGYWQRFQHAVDGPFAAANIEPWMDRCYSVLLANGLPAESPDVSLKSWTTTRRQYLEGQLLPYTNFAFAVTSFPGTVHDNPVKLAGVAPLQADVILINGSEQKVKWTAATRWETDAWLTNTGANALSVTASNSNTGLIIGSNQVSVAFTGTNTSPLGWLIINEIMYHSPASGGDYVELYNRSSSSGFDVSGFRLDGVDYLFPAGSFIGPTNYLIIAEDVSAFAAAYTNVEVVLGSYSGSLDDGGETLKLLMPLSTNTWTVIDHVRYDDDPPWPVSATGAGASLQLIDDAEDNTRIGNWGVGGETGAWYTPGAVNSVARDLPAFPDVWINEVMPVNTLFLDNDNQAAPWAELYNAGESVNVGDGTFMLSDDPSWPGKYTIGPAGQTLAAGDVLTVWCDNQIGQQTSGYPHANWSMNTASGVVMLARITAGVTQILDAVSYLRVPTNKSYGCYPQGDASSRIIMDSPTPNAANNPTSTPVAVRLNEWLASNGSITNDPADSDFDDWFELYNGGDTPVNLAGFRLTDSEADTNKYVIPAGWSIPAGGFLVVWADNESGQTTNGPGGYLHASFKLSATGGVLRLYAPDGQMVDGVTMNTQIPDVSEGRYPDGAELIEDTPIPTPGGPNRLLMATGATLGTGQTVRVTWNARATKRYQTYWRPDMRTSNWLAYGGLIEATGPSIATNLPSSEPQSFYKLVQE